MTGQGEWAQEFARQIKEAFTRPDGAPPPEPWPDMFGGRDEYRELTDEEERAELAQVMAQLGEYETAGGGAPYFEIPGEWAEILLRYIRRLEANQAA